MRKALTTCLVLLFFHSALAQNKKKATKAAKPTKAMKVLKKTSNKKALTPAKKKESSNQSAIIRVEGAMIYEKASFDAAVITYLPINKKVTVSKKTYGPFYRIKVKKGIVGYISDVDIEMALGSKKLEPNNPNVGMFAENPKSDPESPGVEFKKNKKPLEEATVMGLGVSMVNYTEDVFGQQDRSAIVTMFGLKLTGSDFILPTLMDIGISFALSPPSYYADGSATTPSGYLLIADTLLILPFMGGDDLIAYVGLGPFINYSSFKIVLANQLLKLDLLKLGAEAMVGLGFRIEKVVFKVEGKYYYDKDSYFGGTVGIQLSY
ncbi:MAG: SH3 domain-containing protein [Pseudomonadota bacterium]|nr:SH3 domain-containing protein [Pseudomonadota bacterium]